jgi:hypothetical protein
MPNHCEDEHEHSGHSHNDGHDHSNDITPALQSSLYQYINFDLITTLNESVPGSGKAITKKTWAERLDERPELESLSDEQLLIRVPYVERPHVALPHFVSHLIYICVHTDLRAKPNFILFSFVQN